MLKTEKVCAPFQAKAVKAIMEFLSEEEIAIYKRGRNNGGGNVPKNSSGADYRSATGLECLFGYLHLKGDDKRVYELFELIINI